MQKLVYFGVSDFVLNSVDKEFERDRIYRSVAKIIYVCNCRVFACSCEPKGKCRTNARTVLLVFDGGATFLDRCNVGGRIVKNKIVLNDSIVKE